MLRPRSPQHPPTSLALGMVPKAVLGAGLPASGVKAVVAGKAKSPSLLRAHS